MKITQVVQGYFSDWLAFKSQPTCQPRSHPMARPGSQFPTSIKIIIRQLTLQRCCDKCGPPACCVSAKQTGLYSFFYDIFVKLPADELKAVIGLVLCFFGGVWLAGIWSSLIAS